MLKRNYKEKVEKLLEDAEKGLKDLKHNAAKRPLIRECHQKI